MQLQLLRSYETLVKIPMRPLPQVIRPEGPLLAEYENADGLVFVCATVITESTEAKGTRYAVNTVSFAVGILAMFGGSSSAPYLEGSPAGCSLEVTLVEGRSGEVLWRSWVNPKSLDGPKLHAAVRELFARYPQDGKSL